MIKTKFLRWGRGFKRIATEENTLKMLDGFNKTRYSRRKNQEGLLEIASREAHESKIVYFATFYEDDIPFCYIESNRGYFYVGFLDSKLRNYLDYHYEERQPGKLFLKSTSFFEFDEVTNKSIKRTDYKFRTDGTYEIIVYEGNESEILTPQTPLNKDVVDQLWIDYPNFGEYDELIKLERVPSELF